MTKSEREELRKHLVERCRDMSSDQQSAAQVMLRVPDVLALLDAADQADNLRWSFLGEVPNE